MKKYQSLESLIRGMGEPINESVVPQEDTQSVVVSETHTEDLKIGKLDIEPVEIKVQVRDIVNKKENQLKKIDEEQLNEADRGAPYKEAANAAKKSGDNLGFHTNMMKYHEHKESVASSNYGRSSSEAKHHAKQADFHNSERKSCASKLREEAEQIDELSYGKLAQYANKGKKSLNSLTKARQLSQGQLTPSDKLDKKIAGRKVGLNRASTQKVVQLKKIFNEDVALNKVMTVLSELSKATLGRYIRHASIASSGHRLSQGTATGLISSVRSTAMLNNIKGKAENHAKEARKREKGIGKAVDKLSGSMWAKVHAKEEVEPIQELKYDTLRSYRKKASAQQRSLEFDYSNDTPEGKQTRLDNHETFMKRERGRKMKSIAMKTGRFQEEVDLSEGKKEALSKAAKTFTTHPRSEKMHSDMMNASKHFNYVQDACDHVYSNNCNHVKYAEWADMKPHIEDHFRQRGLED